MKNTIILFLLFFQFQSACSQCGIENLESWGTAGGAWLRQSFTLSQGVENPEISIPIFFSTSPITMEMSLYQGSVWDETPTFMYSSLIEVTGSCCPDYPEEENWYTMNVLGEELLANQEYFIQIQDVANASVAFGFGTAGTTDMFPQGEQRDPLTPYSGVGFWFPDLVFRVEGTCVSCDGDLNLDGIVGVQDIQILLNNFGCIGNCVGDINEDGVVGSNDLTILLSLFGNIC